MKAPMRLSTLILRQPFGITETALAADWFGEDVLASEKRKMYELHQRAIAVALGSLPGRLLGVFGGYDEERSSGLDAEWWTVIVYDGEPIR